MDSLLTLNDSNEEIFSGNADLAEVQTLYPIVQKNLVFPNGEAIVISFNSIRQPSESIEGIDDGVSGGFFEPLSEAAKDGNATAAFKLYGALKSCSGRATTLQQLEERLHAIEYESVVLPETPIDVIIRKEKEGFARCEGTNDEMMDQALDLLRLAAEAGDEASIVLYAAEAESFDSSLAEQFYDQLWEQGSVFGLAGLGRIHGAKVHNSHQEAVLSYAYNYAENAINLALMDGLTGELFRNKRERIITTLRELEASTSYSVVVDGTALAREIISNNRSCCK